MKSAFTTRSSHALFRIVRVSREPLGMGWGLRGTRRDNAAFARSGDNEVCVCVWVYRLQARGDEAIVQFGLINQLTAGHWRPQRIAYGAPCVEE